MSLSLSLVVSLLLASSRAPVSGASSALDAELVESLSGKRLLFFGAHPDDEWVLMPLLADACLFRGSSCHFVSVTPGEWGCFETIDEPDLDACARLRRAELARSAALANGTVEVLDWEDLFYAHSGAGLRRTLARWADARGGETSGSAR